VRYTVIEYEPGHRLTFRFDGGGLDGTHGFEIHPDGTDRTRLTHTLSGELYGSMRLLWPTVVQPIHDAYVQDIFDMAELAATGTVANPYRQPRWIRLLNRLGAWRQRRTNPSQAHAADRQ
jgi:hypothetical protein